MLHGDIMINGTVIGSWRAVRQTFDVNEVNSYDCHVELAERGDDKGFSTSFALPHRYTDGPVVLAAKVLGYAGCLDFEHPADEG